jgi:mannan endo-1,4-beta-mannosidase
MLQWWSENSLKAFLMGKKWILIAALALVVGAAIFFVTRGTRTGSGARHKTTRPGFVGVEGARFMVDGQPFRFVGANVAVMYKDEDRARMPETLRAVSENGIRVIRVWANGEGGPNDIGPLADFNDWPRTHSFRLKPDEWNEESFVHLDRVLAEAARQNLRVQLTLCNWWRDTGGITQYLRWAGINDAADDRQPFGINIERAMLFYTNDETRRLYREHVMKVLTRRNTVTGVLYKDDPTIMAYELMNEAQAATGRQQERLTWIKEMSAYVKSLDQDHLLTPGTWGYRNAWERREWLEEHRLETVDFCDVHHYPSNDLDVFVTSTEDLRGFIDNRVAAAYSLRKPLVFGEFGIGPQGYKELAQDVWFRSFFETAARDGVNGAMFWIWTPDAERGFGVTYTSPRDEGVRAEIHRASQLFDSLRHEDPPPRLQDAGRHLVPRQFAFTRPETDTAMRPETSMLNDETFLYRFKPEMAASERFEKLGGGEGYIWGSGVGYVEYLVPEREGYKSVGRLTVRARLQPVPPDEARERIKASRVSLFINGTDCGSRLITREESKQQPLVQQWDVETFSLRLRAARGLPLSIRFVVTPDADQPFGLNLSNWPEGYDAHGAAPIEIEVR